jgi:hypothetical protein
MMSSLTGVTYPFAPRSNAYLAAGQIWDIVLSNGWHAAGVVVAPTALDFGPPGSKGFIAGLLDGTDSSAPSAEACSEAALLDWGSAHIKTITHAGSQILGRTESPLRPIRKFGAGDRQLNDVYANGALDHPATPEERTVLPVAGTWGYHVVNVIAERVFVKRLPLRPNH